MLYRFSWRDGAVDVGTGSSVSDALDKLGYDQGALPSLSHFDELDETNDEDTQRCIA
jgi:hypothetical protein